MGKSTVGWQVYAKLRRAGHHTAFVDLDQIGFYRATPTGQDRVHHALKAANLASTWEVYRARGAERLVVVGPPNRPEAMDAYRAALPDARITLCRLEAGPGTLADRVERCGRGLDNTYGVSGNDLGGRTPEQLRQIARQAVAEAARLVHAGIGDFAVRTDEMETEQIAGAVIQQSPCQQSP